MPENFTSKDIVNRSNVLAEYNENMYTNADGELILPSSSIGSDRFPIGGHCLCFDSSNPDAYIQTTIPSSLRDNYKIVIKGEGHNNSNYRALYVDDSGTNIAIRQVPGASDADVFYLSYIAFINRFNNGKLAYLFECEEGSETTLYEAGGSTPATIESVTSISALRVSKRVKEWIQNENNLDNTYRIYGCHGYAYGETATNFQDIPFPISLCLRFKCTQDRPNTIAEPILYWGTASNSSVTYGVYIGNVNASTSLTIEYLNNSDVNTSTNSLSITNARSLLCDGKWHSIVVCVNTSYLKVYIDGILKGTKNSTYTAISNPPSALNLRLASGHYVYAQKKESYYKDLMIVNFDMSLTDASYTVADYESKKDLSSDLILGTATDKVWLYWQNNTINRIWDGSPNKKHMSMWTHMYSNFNAPDKCYGTWYNNVGGTIDNNGIIIPRKINTVQGGTGN